MHACPASGYNALYVYMNECKKVYACMHEYIYECMYACVQEFRHVYILHMYLGICMYVCVSEHYVEYA